MTSGPLRRAQLIAPFGTGAMVVVRDGTSLITGGLDHWFEREDGRNDSRNLDREEYKFEEWRLQRQLGVDHFRLPPDFRIGRQGQAVPNTFLTVPFLRFPQWHFCPVCYRLSAVSLSERARPRCEDCKDSGRRSRPVPMAQVPFVAICDAGHIQDFPWREWVHRSATPTCRQTMRLVGTGGATLGSQMVRCDCGGEGDAGKVERSLANVTSANPDGTTYLSTRLDQGGQPFLCQGHRPWLGTDEGEACARHLRGSLRSASNVYFASVRNAIYLPRGTAAAPQELIALLEQAYYSNVIKLLSRAEGEVKPEDIRQFKGGPLQPFTDDQIAAALRIVLGQEEAAGGADGDAGVDGDDLETAFRRAEFQVLRAPQDADQLRIRATDKRQYEPAISRFFSRIMLIDKLRETRALAGFTRVYPENDQTPDELKALLRRRPHGREASWLPAYVVYGEGIFLEVNEDLLQEWETRRDVMDRVQPLLDLYRRLHENRRLRDRTISPRFVLLHTLAHLLINRLSFECGYSSAALRERLYVSENPAGPMAGVLIYTAAGDAEGTMGGLVRMGKAGYLEPVIRRALEDSSWCSADPVCMEMGARGGQGPDSCNLAACHNCALVPETACEEFNRFLDRSLVVGALHNRRLGLFAPEAQGAEEESSRSTGEGSQRRAVPVSP